ncbi:hypothetical protein P2T68_28155 [Pseudomonas sp. G11]|uniref:hypothetical protein n=1 Tax=Pseudomonas sp. G11 TaxID=528343 RepID=UPI002402DB41|nr:hypothetical protein [Pseudomonas sp. G11]WEX14451.1 hypothetical protein P2T68_28155 [Pseudomonas sp. G11]
MSFEGIEVIVTVEDYVSTNQYLEKGWILLSINAVGGSLAYTLGRRGKKVDAMEGFALGAHAQQP